MIIDITPIISVILNFLVLCIGLDFVWCGYWYMKTNQMNYLPRLLGYLVLKLFEVGNRRNRSKDEFVNSMFSMKAACIYMLLGGFYFFVRSTFALLTQLIK